MKYFTSDLHFGEERMDIMQRPFSSSVEMENYIINNFNNILNIDDELIIVGDIINKNFPEKIKRIQEIQCKNKILIKGNHDIDLNDQELIKYFDVIIPNGEGIDIEEFYVTHYPIQGKKDQYNLVGHIHSAWKFQLNMINVGVDVNHFRPISIDQIRFFINAIENFYDDDVWCAYNEINSKYMSIRGKKGNYLNG